MKSKLIIVLAVVIALGIGFVAGRFQAGRAWNDFFMDYAYTDASNQAHFYMRTLMFLRQGQVHEAVEFLESRLDGALLTFISYEAVPPKQRNKAGLRAIRNAKDYRAKSPHTNSSLEIQDGIDRVFALTE